VEDDSAMVVDDHTAIVNLESQDEVLKVAQSLQPSTSQSQMLTPPSSDLSSGPPTPLQNTTGRTTRDIIDEIKARAYAKSLSTPEYDQVDFEEELASSDDEQLPDLLLPALKLNK